MEPASDGFLQQYVVELLYDRAPPALDGLLPEVARGCGEPDGVDGQRFRWGSATIQVGSMGGVPQHDDALAQTWRWPAARDASAAARGALLIHDEGAADLPYRDRLLRLRAFTAAVITVAPPVAVVWQPSQQLLDPDEVLRGELLPIAVNVRFFDVGGAPGEHIMDTLGLSALGLLDVQCHFRDLDPADVAKVLYSTAAYVFEHPDAIRPGHTVNGTWRCTYEAALIGPRRTVIDLDPGPPHNARAR